MSPQLLVLIIYCLISPLIAGKFGGRIGKQGGSHSYPSSSGLSGNTISRSHPTHNFQNTRLSGNTYTSVTQRHTYPQSAGVSGTTHGSRTSYVHKTEVHHYHYSPPQQIHYGSVQHPVFHGTPPVYVYQYRESGSKFDNLLTGLALYNLGRMSANQDHYNYNRDYQRDYHSSYKGNPGEVCKFAISKSSGEYEETRIDCKLMSSFIWDFERDQNRAPTNVVTKTVNKSVTTTVTNSTVTVQNVTVIDALQVKGPSITVTPGMTCFMIRMSSYSTLKKKVECGLLQEYAVRSLNVNHCSRIVPVIFIPITLLITFLIFIGN